MDNGACLRLWYAKQRPKRTAQDLEEGDGATVKGTNPSNTRNRVCESVNKHASRLPDGEICVLLSIPAGKGKCRVAGKCSVQVVNAILAAVQEVSGPRRSVAVEQEHFEELLAQMAGSEASGAICFGYSVGHLHHGARGMPYGGLSAQHTTIKCTCQPAVVCKEVYLSV
jgi:hypothetical protein